MSSASAEVAADVFCGWSHLLLCCVHARWTLISFPCCSDGKIQTIWRANTLKFGVASPYIVGNKQLLRRLRVGVHPWWEKKNTSVAWIKIDISNILIFSDPHTKRYYEMLRKPFERRTAGYSEAVNFHFNGLKFNTTLILFYLPILPFSRTFHTIVSIMFLLYIELQKPPLIFPVMNASFYEKKKKDFLFVYQRSGM